MKNIETELTNNILKMIEENAEVSDVNEIYNIWNDSSMIMTNSADTFDILVKAFDMLGLDFATGTPIEEGDHYYIDFA